MKWKKLGRIFDPTKHKLPNNCFEYAQSPQTLILDNKIRIYFSTRNKDKTGKFLSQIAFVDFDRKLKNILKISTDPIIDLGKIGCYDEHGIFPFHIFREKDKIHGYICGWSRRKSVSVDTAIGLAMSMDDGLTFTRIGDGPILTASIFEPFLVGDPFVRIFDNIYYMWYIYGTRWIKQSYKDIPERVYKIGFAISNDGINWQKKNTVQLVSDSLDLNECQALPSVIEYNGLYHMVFCYRHATDFRNNKSRAYRIGYAYTTDLRSWIRDDSLARIDISEKGWDSEMLCYPHIFQIDDKIYLMYNGNEFGRFGFGLAVLEK